MFTKKTSMSEKDQLLAATSSPDIEDDMPTKSSIDYSSCKDSKAYSRIRQQTDDHTDNTDIVITPNSIEAGTTQTSSNTGTTNTTATSSLSNLSDTHDLIKMRHITLIGIGQVFNYSQSKSYKLFSGFIVEYLGITYTMLTYTVFASSYLSLVNLYFSKYYNKIPINIFFCCIFAVSALSPLLLYTLYEYIVILFISRALLTLACLGVWNYTCSILANFVPSKTKKTWYLSYFNAAYPISTVCIVITGIMLENLSYWDYLLFAMTISLILSVLSLCLMPANTIYDANTKKTMDRQLTQNLYRNLKDICSNNPSLMAMMFTAAMDSMCMAILNLFVGPYLTDTYALSAQALGVYLAIGMGTGEILVSAVVIPYMAKSVRFYWLSLAGAFIELCAFIVWNVIVFLNSDYPNEAPPFWFVFIVISFVYFGHEICFAGIMFLMQIVIDPSQQVVSSSLWSGVIAVSSSSGTLLVGQLFTVNQHLLLMILVVLSIFCCIGAITLAHLRRKITNFNLIDNDTDETAKKQSQDEQGFMDNMNINGQSNKIADTRS